MDKMTESELCSIDEAHSIFDDFEPRPFVHVDILSKGKSALEHANTTLGKQTLGLCYAVNCPIGIKNLLRNRLAK
jgi:phosphoribosylformylglycinamidine synthase